MNKLKAVIGITNRTQDNKYIPFLDFDIKDYPNVVISLYRVQGEFNLSNAFIIESTNGYNAFFLDKLTFGDCIYITKLAECDTNFTIYSETKKNFTLRLGNDKKFIKMLPTYQKELTHELSFAHYMFFNEFYKTDILNGIQTTDLNFDKYEELQLVMYMSKKYGYIEVD